MADFLRWKLTGSGTPKAMSRQRHPYNKTMTESDLEEIKLWGETRYDINSA